MTWIKRNVFFVLSMAAGLGVMGFFVYRLIMTVQANAAINDEFTQAVNDLTALEGKTPYPSDENIRVAKENQKRLREFLGEFRKQFAAFPTPPPTDQKGFKTFLEQSLFELHAAATNADVALPTPGYAFSFSGQVGKLAYAPESIAPWMQQMVEIKAMCSILFAAEISSLNSLQRVPVSVDDSGGGVDYLAATIVTNAMGVVTPYRISFRGFSTQIAAVLEGFARSSNCFRVKAVQVIPSNVETPQMSGAASQAQTYTPSPAYSPPIPRLPRNYENDLDRGNGRGEGGRFRPPPPPRQGGMAPPPPAALPPPVRVYSGGSPNVTVLSERPLFVTISVDVIKLKATER